MDSRQLPGALKAAILIRSMGERNAGALLNRLTSEERELITRQINQIGPLSPELVDKVAQEFTLMAQRAKGGGGLMLPQPPAAGGEGDGKAIEGLDALKALGPEDIFELIKDEHPQTMAIVMIHLKTGTASEVLSRMPDEIKTDVAL